MPFISTELSQQEAAGLKEYADFCHESISNIVRKALIREITLADGYGADDPQYEYRMTLPSGCTGSQEHQVLHEKESGAKVCRIMQSVGELVIKDRVYADHSRPGKSYHERLEPANVADVVRTARMGDAIIKHRHQGKY